MKFEIDTFVEADRFLKGSFEKKINSFPLPTNQG